MLVLEDGEARREMIRYDQSHRGKSEIALAKLAASVSSLAGSSATSEGPAVSALPPRRLVPRQIEDVEHKEMVNELWSCDLCHTSIANVFRCVELFPSERSIPRGGVCVRASKSRELSSFHVPTRDPSHS